MTARFEVLAAWLMTGFGLALLPISALVVPATALAQGSFCNCPCTTECATPDSDTCRDCISSCCQSSGGGSTCSTYCCQYYCKGDQSCLDNCMNALAVGCKSHAVCDNGCGMRTAGLCATTKYVCMQVTNKDCTDCGCTEDALGTACICKK